MSIMSKLTAAYIAGFIDGEGYVALEHHRGLSASHYRPVIKIANTNKEIIDWFKESFGGTFETRVPKNKKHKVSYVWVYSGKKLEPFIRKILPYLRQKKPQAEIILKRIRYYDKIGLDDKTIKGWNWKYKQEYIDEMKDLYDQTRRLNKRGV